MYPELAEIAPQILTVFGQDVVVYRGDDQVASTKGIYHKELQPLGNNEAVMGMIISITLPASLKLYRDDVVIYGEDRYFVDRKISDNGQLVKWQLHEH